MYLEREKGCHGAPLTQAVDNLGNDRFILAVP